VKSIELPAHWRARAEDLKRFGPAAAEAFEECARELEQALNHEGNEELNLRQAAKESGYDEDSLGRMVKQGKIPNAGRPGAPRILRRDLPKKAGRKRETGGPGATLTTFGDLKRRAIASRLSRRSV
jgi:hypothetical protein